ncbi:hypothetical protein ABL78_2984 [Leptomonas seymouri]|uniref:Uncharacterized protein n=1 Tax=Leptomonas seymouri TaxID=5684 RepID=A0A0N1I065_LEPSE|nr:hypothetical protein ABL78_2984 [Leptomonas seymouri]|eukprot:KPI87945.1 hypothetical protein ABL78_2984 [Leptomonas seymouri]
MEFYREGLEELFLDGVLNPATTSETYQKNCITYKELRSRVFLLYEPDSAAFPNGAEFDVVLVHGIGSDEFKCWTNAQGVLWPAGFIPQDFPTARVLSVGYAHSLFNWKSDATETVETSAKPLLRSPPTEEPSMDLVPPSKPTNPPGEKSSTLRRIKSLAERVGQTAKESASTLAPKEVEWWWSKADAPRRDGEEGTNQVLPSTPSSTKPLKEGEKEGAESTTQEKQVLYTDNLFQLLTSLRDSVWPLVAAEDESDTRRLSGFTPEGDGATNGKQKKPPRDVKTLQNIRLVAADLAERLGSPEVGVGQRPVVFLVHSMGGLILKQMLISLFEAAHLAPPSVNVLSLATTPRTKELTAQDTSASQDYAAVQRASALLRAVRGVVFYGTPHFGSAVASVITGLQKYYQGLGGLTPTRVVTGLGDHNKPELMRLNSRFFDVIERLGDELYAEATGSALTASQGNATTKCYVTAMQASLMPGSGAWAASSGSMASSAEGGDSGDGSRGAVWILSLGETKKLRGLVRVVDPESANPAPNDPRYPFYLVNADHGEICRPLTKMSPSYAMVYGLLDRMQQRGLLKWQHGQALPTSSLSGTSASTPSGSSGPAREPSAIERMGERYESGWSALFDPARGMPNIPASEQNSRALPSAAPSSAHARLHAGNQRCLLAFQQGVGETRLALPVLEKALTDLHQLLHRFFGVAIPPQLDSIFLLAADMTDFVTRFYRRGELVAQTAESEAGHGDNEAKAASGDGDGRAWVDGMVSFRVPLQILTYWVHHAADLLRVFELSLEERAINTDVNSGASPTAAKWESKLFTHPGRRDLRELSELEQSVGVVQEEWEAFRRYVSLRLRAASSAAQDNGLRRRAGASGRAAERSGGPVGLSMREHIGALFFARAIRTIASKHLHDGGALGGLVAAYLRSAILQIHGAEKQLSSVLLEHDPWSLVGGSGSMDAESIVSLIMEGLELSISLSFAPEDRDAFMDTDGSDVELTSDVELRAIVPALTATSSVLLGCFAAFVDELHRLEGDSRWLRAVQHFQLATSALRADFGVRERLLRAASRAVHSEGLASMTQKGSAMNSSGAERDWWKTAWELTTSKTEASNSGGSSAADTVVAVFTDTCQAHVAKLDDGLLLSAVQLVVESFQCSMLIRACHAHRALAVSTHSTWSVNAGEHVMTEGGTPEPSMERKGGQPAATDALVDDLMRSVEAAQKAYLRTNQILRGLCVLGDAEQPFALPKHASKGRGAGEEAGSSKQPEKRMKNQIRDVIQSLLSELDADENEVGESNKGVEPPLRDKEKLEGKADEAPQSLSWASRASVAKKRKAQSNGFVEGSNESSAAVFSAAVTAAKKGRKGRLPMLIMNSLSKAWEAVRSGGVSTETPEHFACTAMVMWWMVEWEAAAVMKNAATATFPAKKAAETPAPASASTTLAKLHKLIDTMEGTQQGRREAAAGAPASAAASELPPTARAREEKRWLGQCWSNANTAVRCRWMALNGGEEFLRNFYRELLAERDALKQILSSTSALQLRERQDMSVAPSALMQLDGEGGTPLWTPPSLLDAVQHDDKSAAIWCWLGHCYAVHRMRSPSTAHAYLQSICNDCVAHKVYTPAAEVGLAWRHIHSVPCSFSNLWREMPNTESPAPRSPPVVAHAAHLNARGNCVGVRTMASLLDFRATGVADISSLCSVPPQLLQFCHDAVVHHTRAVQHYVTWHNNSHPQYDSGALMHALSLVPPSTHTGSLRHLRLAEEGFQRALRADPANIGALCGLGRLRCLSVSPSLSNCGAREGATSSVVTSSLLSPLAHDAVGVPSTESAHFFSAALNAAATKRLLFDSDATARRASPESCAHAMNNIWLSYAAYWMSEEAQRVRVTSSGLARPLSKDSSASSEPEEWLMKSLYYYPRNDWALTSLGLSYIHKALAQQLKPHESRESEASTPSGLRKENMLEVFELRGLALLQRALTINPLNMWALWGVGTYGSSTPHRTTCQQLLRGLILKSVPRL